MMKKPFKKKTEGKAPFKKRGAPSTFRPSQRPAFKPQIERVEVLKDDEDMRLNKYVALCGIASRRGAAELIKEGHVTVNGKVCLDIGERIKASDVITFKGNMIKPIEQKIYVLLNKPKDTITTVSDERGRKTVMDIVNKTIKARIYPVGRLDRDTTGLLLLTNDGDLAQKMSHPSYLIKKIYAASLDKPLSREDLTAIAEGVELEDGKAEVDAINYMDGASKSDILVEIHIGKNRIVRRIFEHLGYNVLKLDRVYYGGLTKKDLPRGTYRKLTDREVIMLKHFTGK